jgi:beta-glucanase (GH16 family)
MHQPSHGRARYPARLPWIFGLLALFIFAASPDHAASAPKAEAAKPADRVLKSALKKGWILTFHDEFDGKTVDTTKWNIYDRPAQSNNEQQYYAPDDVGIHRGCLRLTSRKRDFKGHAYTSGAVNSSGKFDQEYGYFEIRAKLPGTRGLWPAHWLLPENMWPPEIDIMELLGHEPRKVYMTNHWMDGDNHLSHSTPYEGPDYTKGFHTFAVEWAPDKITWYVDGVERASNTEGVPHRPFYIILNTAVGGDWPRNPDATTRFPQFHDIDYVRVYKKDV